MQELKHNEINEDREIFWLESKKHFEAMNLLEGCYIECLEKWSVPYLRYNYHRMYFICAGEAYYEEGERCERLRKGHLYIFPSQSKRYSIRHNPQDPLQVLWCHFEIIPDLVNDLIDYNPQDDEEFMLLLDVWRRIAKLPQPGNEMYNVVMLLLYTLERRIQFLYADFPFMGIERYVSEHIQENLTVSSMASYFGYTRSHFTRKFKSSYHLSPGEYLRVVRMSKAANMLQYGFDIGQVCAALGFTDKKVFSRAFKTYYGLSPSIFVKKHKMQP